MESSSESQKQTFPTNPSGNETMDQARRAGFYSLLAALLRDAPAQQVLDYCTQLDTGDQRTELGTALNALVLAARHSTIESLRDEFHTLFIGLGRGELVPYGSWYQTGFLMERPLGQLRMDLAKLGFERSEEVHEPEDHVAALFEVMALLIGDEQPLEQQYQFYETHIVPGSRTSCKIWQRSIGDLL